MLIKKYQTSNRVMLEMLLDSYLSDIQTFEEGARFASSENDEVDLAFFIGKIEEYSLLISHLQKVISHEDHSFSVTATTVSISKAKDTYQAQEFKD